MRPMRPMCPLPHNRTFFARFHVATANRDTVSEWLRRWTRNPLGSARKGSNPFGVDDYVTM